MDAGTIDDSAASLRTEEPEPGVVWITIDRPHKHNALARPLLAALARAFTDVSRRDGLKYVVLTGAGDRYFAAGGDLRDLSSVRDEAAVKAMTDDACAALDSVRQCPVPVLAYLNGDAIGGGAELALACDMRLQARHAHIGYIQAKLAIGSAWGGGPDLFRLVGPARAVRMMSRCELVGAEQALAWGLADAVIADGPHGADMTAFTRPIAACAPQVLRAIKAQARAARQGLDWPAHRRIEQEHLTRTWLHADHWSASDKLLSRGSR